MTITVWWQHRAQPLLQSKAGDPAAKSRQTLSAVCVAAPTISVIFCGWLIFEDAAALGIYRLNRRRLEEIFGKGLPMFLEARFRNKPRLQIVFIHALK